MVINSGKIDCSLVGRSMTKGATQKSRTQRISKIFADNLLTHTHTYRYPHNYRYTQTHMYQMFTELIGFFSKKKINKTTTTGSRRFECQIVKTNWESNGPDLQIIFRNRSVYTSWFQTRARVQFSRLNWILCTYIDIDLNEFQQYNEIIREFSLVKCSLCSQHRRIIQP